MIQDLIDGCFYQQLNSAVRGVYQNSGELKVAVQRGCLFGKRMFGMTSLFRGMHRLYPDLARFILYKRNNHSVRWLRDLMTNAEGSFFIDGVLPFVVKAGVPALPIHDAVVVPSSAAEQVRRWCGDLAQDRFGFVPKFKVT